MKATFGDGCFETDTNTLRAAPGAFVTDIDVIQNAYGRALLPAISPEERLFWLIEAEGEIGGPFLEGCFRPGDDGEPWLLGRRAEIHAWIASLLFDLADAFEQAGNLSGAMEAARRAVVFAPESEAAQNKVWRLAQNAGKTARPALAATHRFEEAVERVVFQKTAHLTGEEIRLFSVLFKTKYAALPAPVQKALGQLAVLPAPFSPEIAAAVVRVSRRTLLALSRTALLQKQGDEFALSDLVRACTLRQVPTTTKQQLEKRLARVCETWISGTNSNPNEPTLPFASVKQATPFLRVALQWSVKQTPTRSNLEFIHRLHVIGLADLAYEAMAFLDRVRGDETYPDALRHAAGQVAAPLFFKRNEFAAAIACSEQALGFPPEAFKEWGDAKGLHFLLGNAYHYAGNSQAALPHIDEAKKHFEREGVPNEVANCLRFRAEILNHLGDYEEALRSCDAALALWRTLHLSSSSVACGLFWKGSTLLRLNRPTEAGDCIEDALSIWQETGDTTGIGFCLRVMGRLCARQNRFAEARAHIEHAILLHEKMNDAGSRRAAVEAKADVYLQEGRVNDALLLYEECLKGHEAQQHEKAVGRLQTRIQICHAHGLQV